MFASIGFAGIATSRVAVSIRLTLKQFTLKMAYVFSCDLRTLRTPTRPIVMAQFRNIGSFGFVLFCFFVSLVFWIFGISQNSTHRTGFVVHQKKVKEEPQ